MPFPTARFTVHDVDSSRGHRPHCSARANAKARGRVRSSLSSRRTAQHPDRSYIRCLDLSDFPRPITSTAPVRAENGCGSGQCRLASCASPCSVVARPQKRFAFGLPTALQPRTQCCRARLETDTAPLYTQSVLRLFGTIDRYRCKTTQHMVQT